MPRKNKSPKRRSAKAPAANRASNGASDRASDGAATKRIAANLAAIEHASSEDSPDSPPIKRLVVKDHYTPFPRQEEFHTSKAKYRLFGGAAGPGKTKALLWEAIRQANEFPKVDTLLLRRTFPELESSLISYFRRDVPRDLYKNYNDSKHIVTWLNGSTTRFGYSAGENDIYQYQGAEFLFIGIDELTLFTLGQWQFLTSRNRCAVPGTWPNMAGATNPGNIGHAWVKALWVDKRPAPGMDRAEQYDPHDYDFIRATLDDNPLYKDDARYRRTLEALPRHMRQAFLLGDWNVFAGQYFDSFSERCVCRAERLGIESWWPRWISIDWGFEHPSAVYWHAAQPGGGVVTYREFVANHLSPRMLGQAIAERSIGLDSCSSGRPARLGGEAAHEESRRPGGFSSSTVSGLSADASRSPAQVLPCASSHSNPGEVRRGEPEALGSDCHPERSEGSLRMHGGSEGGERSIRTRDALFSGPERITEVFLSPDAFAHRTSDSSIAEQLGEVLAANGLPRPVPADDDRVGGWMLMYQMFEEGKWVIADSCTRLIECIPTLVRDPANVEDVQKMSGDDPCLALGTMVQCRHGLVPIENVKPGEQVMTRKGWRKVLWSGMTAPNIRRFGVALSNGARLIGTANHLIFINGVWARLDMARYGDTLLACTKKPSFIAAVATGVIRALKSVLTGLTSLLPARGEIAYCTAISGGTPTVPFPLGITSITSMETHSTTASVISNASRHGSTLLGIRKRLKSSALKVLGVWSLHGRELRSGINRRKYGSLPKGCRPNSCGCDENARDAERAESRFGGCRGVSSVPMHVSLAGAAKWASTILKNAVNVAASALRQIGTRACGPVPVHVLGVTEEIPGPVYNLTIQGEPEFFANGVLVHNCDSARYGLKSRLAPGRVPAEQRIAEKLDSAGALDPTSRAIWMQKFMHDDRRSRRAAPLPRRW